VSEQTPDPRSVDFPAIARVSNTTVLTGVRFSSAYADIFAEPETLPDDWGTKSFLGFRTAYRQNDDCSLDVQVSFLAFYRGTEDLNGSEAPEFVADDPPDLILQADLELHYEVAEDSEFGEDDVAQFAQVNSPMHAWPYWREFAQSSCARLEVPVLVVGMYKLPSVFDPGAQDHD
jgi:hypothetical protein